MPSSNSFVQGVIENYIPTAIATLIEPFWILINRLLCLLQPIEELQSCKAKAKDSIDLNYNSLPPQLVIFKALRAKHFVLATVCVMALLTNVLAVAFAGLFYQETIDMRHAISLTPPFEFKFVNINGSIGPDPGFMLEESSGAWRGGNGQNQFLVAESNITSKTPLPGWTDKSTFYVPVFSEGFRADIDDTHFEVDTKAFGADLDCTNLNMNGANFRLDIKPDPERYNYLDMKLKVLQGSRQVECIGSVIYSPPGRDRVPCFTGPSAAELSTVLEPSNVNATSEDEEICKKSMIFGWARSSDAWCGGQLRPFGQKNSTFVHCTPKLRKGQATVRVDAAGRLQKTVKNLSLDNDSSKCTAEFFLAMYAKMAK